MNGAVRFAVELGLARNVTGVALFIAGQQERGGVHVGEFGCGGRLAAANEIGDGGVRRIPRQMLAGAGVPEQGIRRPQREQPVKGRRLAGQLGMQSAARGRKT